MTTLLVGSAKVKKGHGAHDEWLEAVSQILCCMDAQQQQHQHQQQSEVTVEAKRLFLFRVSRSEKQKSVIPQAHMTARLGHAFFLAFAPFQHLWHALSSATRATAAVLASRMLLS